MKLEVSIFWFVMLCNVVYPTATVYSHYPEDFALKPKTSYHGNEPLGCMKGGEFLNHLNDC